MLLLAPSVILVTTIWVSLIMLTPQLHKSILRQYVGSKVVMIVSDDPTKNASYRGGTGFHVKAASGKTYIVTNRHVCQGAKNDIMWAGVRGETNYKKVKILERSDETDLCLVEPLPEIEGLSLGTEPYIGQHVAVVGHPNLQPRTYTEGDVVGREMYEIAIGVIGEDGFKDSDCENKDTRKRVYDREAAIRSLINNRLGSLFDIEDILGKDGKIILGTKQSKKITICTMLTNSLVTTAMIFHGSSGSPTVDFFGNVVGVMYAVSGDNIWGRAVGVTSLKSFLLSK